MGVIKYIRIYIILFLGIPEMCAYGLTILLVTLIGVLRIGLISEQVILQNDWLQV